MGAKSYVLNLSENVRRSLEYKRRNGEWGGKAALGYPLIVASAKALKVGSALLDGEGTVPSVNGVADLSKPLSGRKATLRSSSPSPRRHPLQRASRGRRPCRLCWT